MILISLSFFILCTSHAYVAKCCKRNINLYFTEYGLEASSYPAITDIPQYFKERENSL